MGRMNQMIVRTFSELCSLKTFQERYEYLRLDGSVGEQTFGFDRYMNQKFYKSAEWKSIRDYVVARDNGCDLGIEGHEIFGRILIHHMNPIFQADIANASENLLNPEFLISTTHITHNAIHYGNAKLIEEEISRRERNDTCPWKH